MATYGLGNFRYDFSVDGKAAKFKFYDPEDVSNTAEVAVEPGEFPEGVNQPDSRQVADLAYSKVAKQLNDKRDARVAKEAAEEVKKQNDADAASRAAANDYFANTVELADKPNYGEEKQSAPAKNDKKK